MSESPSRQEEINLTVAAEKVVQDNDATNDDDNDNGIDVVKRDPRHSNDHVKVTFDEIFAEPHTTVFSFDKIWLLSYKVFTNTKLWTYRIITLVLSIPLSAVWGVYFACLAFCTIWCCRPCIRSCDIEFGCLRGFWEILLSTFLRPVFETMGYCFSNVRIRTTKETV